MTLAKWQSHKVVRAGRIVSVSDDRVDVEGWDGAILVMIPLSNMFARYRPVPGDYWVEYDNNYASISPRAAFEAGYRRLDA